MRITKKLYQWDTDQKLVDCVGKYVDFPIDGGVYRIDVIDKECIIPDELLQVSGTVKVYECMEYGTVKAFAFYINPRPKPPDYVFTPTERLTFEGLVKKVDETIADLQKRADSGEFNGSDYVITDSDYDAIAAKTAGKLQPTIGELARTLETEKTDREQADISLQKDISGKLSEPVEGIAVGKYFRVAALDENGHAVLEAVDLPIASGMQFGVVRVQPVGAERGIYISSEGFLATQFASVSQINNRTNFNNCITPYNLDYAVKAAMCDGKGAAWTADEQAAARERMEADGGTMEFIADITTTEDADVISIDKFPDGTPLKLKSFDLYFIIPKASVDDNITSGYKFKYNNETQITNRDSANKLISSKHDSYNNTYVMWNNARPIGFTLNLSSWANGSQSISTMIKYDNRLNFAADYICEVHLTKYTSGIQIPSGTRMVLWGVIA